MKEQMRRMARGVRRVLVGEKLADLGLLPADPNQWQTHWTVRKFGGQSPVVDVRKELGGGDLSLQLPCTVETAQQLEAIAGELRKFLATDEVTNRKFQA